MGRLGFGLKLLEPRLRLGDGVELEISGPLHVAGASRLHRLDAHLVELLLELADSVVTAAFGLPLFAQRGELFAQIAHVALHLMQPLARRVVFLALERRRFDLKLQQSPLQTVELLWLGIDLYAARCGGLVDEIDRLVRKEARGDVPVAQSGRCHERGILDDYAVVLLVSLAQSPQNGDRRADRRLAYHHWLEAALEGRVFLDVRAVLVVCRRADAAQLAACE
mmetsp:Transcript_25403/g.77064  ORF Transcript_25403/g.77064 Transcript_25403/m.77064 type:complete len:223 (-) Transcript_25403:556-1224(-)|eukprot:scaffold75767_cov28-Tisochrysis_lutea.AAC.2